MRTLYKYWLLSFTELYYCFTTYAILDTGKLQVDFIGTSGLKFNLFSGGAQFKSNGTLAICWCILWFPQAFKTNARAVSCRWQGLIPRQSFTTDHPLTPNNTPQPCSTIDSNLKCFLSYRSRFFFLSICYRKLTTLSITVFLVWASYFLVSDKKEEHKEWRSESSGM